MGATSQFVYSGSSSLRKMNPPCSFCAKPSYGERQGREPMCRPCLTLLPLHQLLSTVPPHHQLWQVAEREVRHATLTVEAHLRPFVTQHDKRFRPLVKKPITKYKPSQPKKAAPPASQEVPMPRSLSATGVYTDEELANLPLQVLAHMPPLSPWPARIVVPAPPPPAKKPKTGPKQPGRYCHDQSMHRAGMPRAGAVAFVCTSIDPSTN